MPSRTEAMVDNVENLIAHYQKALLIKPDSAVIHSELGKLYAFQGRYENVPYHYIKAIESDPSCFQTYWNLKFSLISLIWYGEKVDLGLLNQEIETLRSVIQNQPNFPFAYAILGDLLTQKGSQQEAIDCYQTASHNQILLSRPDLANRTVTSNQKSQPSFLILGFMRCGTSSLYDYLLAHPQVLPAVDKELWFFTHFFDQGIDWYLAHFPSIADGVNYFTGEATSMYINAPDAATKVLDLFPEMKLTILLRNPVERVISAIYLQRPPSLRHIQLEHHIVDGLEKAESMVKNLSEVSLLESSSIMNCGLGHQGMVSVSHLLNGLYILYLKRWLTIFPKNQFLILKSETLFKDPSITMNQVHNFLKLSDYQLTNYRNSNPGTYPSVSNDLRRRIAAFYQPYNQQLEDYLGMKFDWE